MQRGHVAGTKRERASGYPQWAIEEMRQTIARLKAEEKEKEKEKEKAKTSA